MKMIQLTILAIILLLTSDYSAGKTEVRTSTPTELGEIISLTYNQDIMTVFKATIALSDFGGEIAMQRLLEMSHDQDPDIRISAMIGLSQIDRFTSAERLLEMSYDESTAVRYFSIGALARMVNLMKIPRRVHWQDTQKTRYEIILRINEMRSDQSERISLLADQTLN